MTQDEQDAEIQKLKAQNEVLRVAFNKLAKRVQGLEIENETVSRRRQ